MLSTHHIIYRERVNFGVKNEVDARHSKVLNVRAEKSKMKTKCTNQHIIYISHHPETGLGKMCALEKLSQL